MTVRNTRPLWVYGILLITVCSFFIYLFSPYLGDDLVYKSVFNGASPNYDSWLKYPRWVARHWFNSNGRLPNFIMPLLFTLPKFIVAALCSMALWLMYRLSVSAARGSSAMLLVGCIFFLLPWWDSFFLFACQTNYVWASAGILAVYLLLFGQHRCPLWLGTIICFIGGTMHEAASASFISGLIVYAIVGNRGFERYQKIILIAFCLGAAFTIFSPGIISRAARNSIPDDPWYLILLKSDFIALGLWVAILVCGLIPKLRGPIVSVLRSPLCVLAVGALAGSFISAASGIVGRSGWFAELFALIVIARIVKIECRWFSWTLLAIITLVMAGCIVWQFKVWQDFKKFETDFSQSCDGVVYMDVIRDNEIPVWLTLNRLRGIPDPDDAYLLYSLSKYYRTDGSVPKIIPTCARRYEHVPPDSIVKICNRDIVTIEELLPNEVKIINKIDDNTYVYGVEIDGELYVIQSFGRSLHLSPLILDPGDRIR